MTDRSAARAVPAGAGTRATPARAVAARAAAAREVPAPEVPRATTTGRQSRGAGTAARRGAAVADVGRAEVRPARPHRAAGATAVGTPRAAPARGATAARTRRRGSAVTGRRTPFVLLVVALLVGTTLGLLVLNTAIAVDSLKATRLQAGNAERAQDVQRLEQQVVTGAAPAQIADAARDAGLVPAGTAAYLVIAPDGSVELRGTPEPAPAPAPAVPFAPAVPLVPATLPAEPGDGG